MIGLGIGGVFGGSSPGFGEGGLGYVSPGAGYSVFNPYSYSGIWNFGTNRYSGDRRGDGVAGGGEREEESDYRGTITRTYRPGGRRRQASGTSDLSSANAKARAQAAREYARYREEARKRAAARARVAARAAGQIGTGGIENDWIPPYDRDVTGNRTGDYNDLFDDFLGDRGVTETYEPRVYDRSNRPTRRTYESTNVPPVQEQSCGPGYQRMWVRHGGTDQYRCIYVGQAENRCPDGWYPIGNGMCGRQPVVEPVVQPVVPVRPQVVEIPQVAIPPYTGEPFVIEKNRVKTIDTLTTTTVDTTVKKAIDYKSVSGQCVDSQGNLNISLAVSRAKGKWGSTVLKKTGGKWVSSSLTSANTTGTYALCEGENCTELSRHETIGFLENPDTLAITPYTVVTYCGAKTFKWKDQVVPITTTTGERVDIKIPDAQGMPKENCITRWVSQMVPRTTCLPTLPPVQPPTVEPPQEICPCPGSWEPGTQGRWTPGSQGRWNPGTQGTHIPGRQGQWIPGSQGQLIPGTQAQWIPGSQGEWLPGSQGQWTNGTQAQWIPGSQGRWIPGQQGTFKPGQQGFYTPGTQRRWIPGKQGRCAPCGQGSGQSTSHPQVAIIPSGQYTSPAQGHAGPYVSLPALSHLPAHINEERRTGRMSR